MHASNRRFLAAGLACWACGLLVEAQAPPRTMDYEFGEEDIRQLTAPLVASLLAAELPVEPPPRLAWLRLRNDTESKATPIRQVMEALEVALVKSGRVQVLSRTQLEALASEHAIQLTSYPDPAVVGKLSTLAQVQYWFAGTLRSTTNREAGKEFVYYNLSVSLTDAVTTAKAWADVAEIKKERNLQLFEKTRMKQRARP